MSRSKIRNLGVVAAGLAVAVMLVPDDAEARRRGSFGSRGARTHEAPAATAVAPRPTAPVQRSMTEKPAAGAASAQPGRAAPAKPGGMAKGLIGGLIAGGLIGALLGGGLGALGGSGMLMALLQVVLIGGLAWFLFRMFRNFRRRPTLAGAHGGTMPANFGSMTPREAYTPSPAPGFSAAPAIAPSHDIEINDADRQAFERLLIEVQDAFGKEDYARLRERTTPEVMSYFAEELGQNATRGWRNHVADTRLIDAEVAEAWREGSNDYATIAMRYESIDVMLDRSSGAVVEGDLAQSSRATELWTFKRELDGPWRLSAIQEA